MTQEAENKIEEPSTVKASYANLTPLSPIAFFKSSLPVFNGPLWHLLLSWLAFQWILSPTWALHLKGLMGQSAMAAYWGDRISAREIWDVLVNGELQHRPMGFWVAFLALIFLLSALWAAWRVQENAVGRKASVKPWVMGLIDAIWIGILPLLLIGHFLGKILVWMGNTGFQGLAYIDLVARPLLYLTLISAFLLQWWLCRGERAEKAAQENAIQGLFLGTFKAYLIHLGDCLLRFWAQALSWIPLLAFGVVLRMGLHGLVLWLGWMWGGATVIKVLALFFLQGIAALSVAYLMAWMLRLVARFNAHDRIVKLEIRTLSKVYGHDDIRPARVLSPD